ncbi:Gfo/Idh/MocA family protein [Nocardia sp. NPDC056541]|uniref:Gfo/Idh/MocA family protein n=1 Tax=Nocardia sp. NPDC056541 TaxID=3345860 RepID=UPI00366D7529
MISTNRQVVIVGASSAVAPRHIEAFHTLPSTQVVALVEVDPNKAEQLRSAYPAIAVYSRVADIDQDGIDLAVVCVPDFAHGPVVLECLDRGWNVLCEKPLTDDVSLAEQLFAHAERAGLVLSVGYQRRHMLSSLGAQIIDGLIGELYWVDAWWLRREGHPDSRREFTRSGSGVRGDLVPHLLSQTLQFLDAGQLVVQARDWHISPGWSSEDVARLTIRDGKGVELQLNAAYDKPHLAEVDDCGIAVYGTLGSVHVQLPTSQDELWAHRHPPTLYPRDGSSVRKLEPLPSTQRCHLLQAESVMDTIEAAPTPAAQRSAEMALIRTVAAAQASATWHGVAIPVESFETAAEARRYVS